LAPRSTGSVRRAIAIVFSALVYNSEVSASFGILVGYKPIELAEFEGGLSA